MTQSGSAVRNAFLCTLAGLQPKHLKNNSPLDLINGSISEFGKREKHHIFPWAYLEEHGPPGADIHSLPNFCFLPAELNNWIKKKAPSEYVTRLREDNSEFDKAARSHLLPAGNESGLLRNDYLAFLSERAGLILEQIGRLCGDITSPSKDERQATIEEIERELRDLINGTLWHKAQDAYWKQCIPKGVKEQAEGRIASELKKSPNLKKEDFQSHRRKLDYCNVMDYYQIMTYGQNWPAFEGRFRNKGDLERYLSGFSDYRNAAVHNREMPELVAKNGEAAIIWLESVLDSEERPVDDA